MTLYSRLAMPVRAHVLRLALCDTRDAPSPASTPVSPRACVSRASRRPRSSLGDRRPPPRCAGCPHHKCGHTRRGPVRRRGWPLLPQVRRSCAVGSQRAQIAARLPDVQPVPSRPPSHPGGCTVSAPRTWLRAGAHGAARKQVTVAGAAGARARVLRPLRAHRGLDAPALSRRGHLWAASRLARGSQSAAPRQPRLLRWRVLRHQRR